MSLSTRAAATAAPPARVEDLLSRLKSGERKPELLCAIGQSYFEKQQFDLAANAYREALDLDPAHGTARLNLAVCLEKLNRWADAAEQFEKALQIDSTREEAHLGLGICYLHLDRPRQALEIFERVLEKDEADQVALVGKAVALQLMEQAEEANLLYQRIFEDPAETREAAVELQADRQPHKIRDNVVVINAEYQRLETLVMSSIAEARFEDAVGHCRRLTELSPEHFAAWFNLGLAQQQLGHTEEARDAYRKAVSLKPDAAPGHINLGMVQLILGELGSAREAFRAVLELEPESEIAHWNLALTLEQLNDPVEALGAYERLLSINPEWEEAWFRQGVIHLEQEAYEAAAGCFGNCIQRRPTWQEARLNLALALFHKRDFAGSRHHYQEMLKLDAKHAGALQGLATVELETENFEAASEVARKLGQAGKPAPEVFFNIGLSYQRNGRYRDAIRYYREALEAKPGFPEALLNLGHIFKEQGKDAEALDYWSQALKSRPDLAAGYFTGVIPELV